MHGSLARCRTTRVALDLGHGGKTTARYLGHGGSIDGFSTSEADPNIFVTAAVYRLAMGNNAATAMVRDASHNAFYAAT